MLVTQHRMTLGFLVLAVAALVHPLAGPLLVILALLAGTPGALLACVPYLLSGQLGAPGSLVLLAWMQTRISTYSPRASRVDARCPTCNWIARPCACGQQAGPGDSGAPWPALPCLLAVAVAWLAGPLAAAWARGAVWCLSSLHPEEARQA